MRSIPRKWLNKNKEYTGFNANIINSIGVYVYEMSKNIKLNLSFLRSSPSSVSVSVAGENVTMLQEAVRIEMESSFIRAFCKVL